jgi:hypothetical protein
MHAGDERQKLWFPLVLKAGRCSVPVKRSGFGGVRTTQAI